MKRLITIILALIMALFTAPNQGADQADVSHVNAPVTTVAASVEQEPREVQITAETEKTPEQAEAETDAPTTETTPEPKEAEMKTETLTEETTEAVEIAEEIIITETDKPSQEELDIDEPSNDLVYKPSIGGENPFENNTPTEIDDTPVEDYIGEGEDRPGEGIHF